VDCHFHVYDASYPVIPGVKLEHADASVKDHLQLRRRLGLTRSVIVQPSLYGADNRLLMSALAELGQSCRGVIAVAPQTSAEELRSLHEAGVRGARINLQFPAPGVVNDLQALDAIVARLGWSIELNANAHDIVGMRKPLAQLRSPLVF
jgi:predicted TIM-barrel fold metal-dependent hydrolase